MLLQQPGIVNDGLVLYLDAGIKGSYSNTGTTWTDLARGNNGTLTNGPTFNSSNGGSIVFDGSDDYIGLGNPSSLNFGAGDFTLEFWVYPARISYGAGDQGTIVSKDYRNIEIYFYENKLSTYISYGARGFTGLTNNTSLTTNTWYHLAISRISGTCRQYKNATQYGQNANANDITTNVTGNWQLGNRYGSNVLALHGRIAIARFYSKGLTATEITQNFETDRNRFGI